MILFLCFSHLVSDSIFYWPINYSYAINCIFNIFYVFREV